ncbi:endothelin-converting enzyme 2-like [Haemaphysalis longicornis]
MAENDDDSSASVTETQFVTADYTELCLVTFGCLCLVGLAAGLAWYFIFYDPIDKDSDRHRANYTQLLEESLTRSISPCSNFYRFVCTGWIRNHGQRDLSIAERVQAETMLDAQEALENAANKFSREDYARSLHFVPSDANSSHFEIGNASSSFVIQLPVSRNRRSRRQSLEASAIGKAAAMFALCKDVVDKKQSEINKLSDFTRIFTPFPNVETMDAAKALKLMVELSLAWKINIMFAVDVFADHDEGGRPTVSISENREELSDWLRYRNVLKETGKLEKFYVAYLQELPGFRHSVAEELSTTITEADTEIITSLFTTDVEQWAGTYGELHTLIPNDQAQLWVEAINRNTQPYFRVQLDHYLKVGNKHALVLVADLLVFSQNSSLISTFIGWQLHRQLAPRASYKAATFLYKDRKSYVRDCFRRVAHLMPLAASYPYFSGTPTPDAKVLAKKLTKDIRKEFKAIFRKTPWMDASTRTAALDKMEDMGEVLVKPEFLDDEEALDERYANFSVHEDYLTTSLHAASASTHRSMSALVAGESVARRSFSPLEVNAFYERELNAMFVSAAIMQPPYLAEKAWTAFNYAGLGAVVGHEVMHGFDDRGKDRNARGELDDWWTPDVLRAYQEKVACFQRSYGDAADGLMEENVADFASLPAVLGAYRLRSYIQDRERTPTFLEFTREQLFYINYCFKLCSQQSGGNGAQLYATDEQRCNVPLAHLREFAEAFGCAPSDNMAIEDTCSFWDVLIPEPSIDEEPLNNQPDSYLLRAATG